MHLANDYSQAIEAKAISRGAFCICRGTPEHRLESRRRKALAGVYFRAALRGPAACR